MPWSCGIVGLPNAGKSTLFKALTKRDVTIQSYPFSTIDPNKAVIYLPDERLQRLAEMASSEKVTSGSLEIIDVAGLVKGASRGEGLGNQFLGHLRNVDLLIHLVAIYDQGNQIMPDLVEERIAIVNTELCLADLDIISRRKEKIEPKLKSTERRLMLEELELLERLAEHLDLSQPLRIMNLKPEEIIMLQDLSLLTLKEMIYVFNHAEDFTPGDQGYHSFFLCASLEAELAELPEADRISFMEAYDLKESRTELLVKECYDLLKLITFYTIKGSEARGWIIPAGTSAVEAAGKIHSDMEKGFINVEVFPCDLLLAEGGPVHAREKGLSRVEGRDYLVKDGEVLFIRFR